MMQASPTRWRCTVGLMFLAFCVLAGCKRCIIVDCFKSRDGEVRRMYFMFSIDNQTNQAVKLSVRPYDHYKSPWDKPPQLAPLLPPRGIERRVQTVQAHSQTTEDEMLIIESLIDQSYKYAQIVDPKGLAKTNEVCSFLFGVKRADASTFTYYSGRDPDDASDFLPNPPLPQGILDSSLAGYSKGIVWDDVLFYKDPLDPQPDDAWKRKRVSLAVVGDGLFRENPDFTDRCVAPGMYIYDFDVDTVFAIYDVTMTDTDVKFSLRDKKTTKAWAQTSMEKNSDQHNAYLRKIFDKHYKYEIQDRE